MAFPISAITLLWATPIYQDHCNGLLTYPQLLILLHNSQMFRNQILSFSFRWSLLWMLMSIIVEAEVLMVTLFQAHHPSSFSLNIPYIASWLGAISLALGIAGILFYRSPDGALLCCHCLSLLFSMESSHFKVQFIHHPPFPSTNKHL